MSGHALRRAGAGAGPTPAAAVGDPDRREGEPQPRGADERVYARGRSPEYQLFLRLLNSRSLAQVPAIVRAWWRAAGQRSRLLALLLLPVAASLASGLIAAALVLVSVLAQFVVVPALVAASFVGYGLAIVAGCASAALFCVVAVLASATAFAALVFGFPVIAMHLSDRSKRENAMRSLRNGVVSFRRSFREALLKAQMEQRSASGVRAQSFRTPAGAAE